MQFTDVIQQLSEWMESLVLQYGYFGIFFISLVGALSIFFPIPYTVVIFTLGGLQNNGVYVFDPVWIATAAGLGSALGEFSGYLIGFGGRKVISERYKRRMELLVKVFNRYGPIVIFLFALTPFPDDLLFIPLGVMHYSILRAFIPALVGKFCMNLIVAYSGRLSINLLRDIFGVESTWTSALLGIILALVLLVAVFVIMFKVNWEERLEKYISDKDEEEAERQKPAEKPDGST